MPLFPEKPSLPASAEKWQKSFEATGRLAPAYLLIGPPGSGTETLAFSMAQIILGLPEDKKEHPDLIHLIAEKTTLKIEPIREMLKRISLKPFQAQHIVVIIEEADTLTENAANALLKNLEEPPADVVFLLTTTTEQKLPITVRSRCQKLQIAAPAQTIREEAQKHWNVLEISPEEFSGKASFARASKLAETIVADPEKVPHLLESLKYLWHDLIVCRESNEQTLAYPEFAAWIQKESQRRHPETLFEDYDWILETEKAVQSNVNKTLALERLFVKLMAA